MTVECYDQICANRSEQNATAGVGAFLSKLWTQFKTRRAEIRQRKIDRDAFAHLVTLDESQLKDIGLRRDDVLWASQLPLSQNASQELEIVARGHRRS